MDAKEQELIDAGDEANRKWNEDYRNCVEADRKLHEADRKRDEVHREMVEAYHKWGEASREMDKAYCKLWKYQKSKAQQGGKVEE